MALKQGSSGDEVTALQKALVEAGYTLTVDGIYGSKTAAAVTSYQKRYGLTQDGIAGTKTLSSMGLATGESGADGSEMLLQGPWELWRDDEAGQWIAVKVVPGVTLADGTTTDEMYISWTIENDEDLEAVLGPDVDPVAARTVTGSDLSLLGVVNFGGVDELRDWGGFEGDPLTSWEEDVARMAITRPWILEPDWMSLTVMAIFEREDPTLTLDEIQTTNWYREHSDAERRWMETVHGDPATAEQWVADSQEAIRIKLRNSGINNVPDDIADWIAMQVVTGAWTQEKLDFQIRAISDPYSNVDPDAGLLAEMKAFRWAPNATQEKEDDVRSLLDKWLGPALGSWTDQQVAAKAGDLRNDPDAETNFIETLKDQRVALWGAYTDRNASYQDIAQPWKNFGYAAWGQEMDETDPMFLQMLRQNDAALAGSLLNREGLKRDVGKVVNDTQQAMTDAFGGTVR